MLLVIGEKKSATLTVPTLGSTPALGTTTSTTPAVGSSGVQVSVPPPSMLRGKAIEEIVNKWTQDLETQVKEFERFAREVAVWDRNLIDSGNNVWLTFTSFAFIVLNSMHITAFGTIRNPPCR